MAFINTQIGAAFAAVTWMILDWKLKKKPSLVGFCVGAVAGLATVTPAAGYVTPQGAMLIGLLPGSIPCAAVVGILALGLLATKAVNSAGADGLFYGNGSFFVKKLVGATVGVAWAFIVVHVLLWVINKLTPARLSDEEEQAGLDRVLHGETTYISAD